MRIFVLTATYELRVSRKSHLRDHPMFAAHNMQQAHPWRNMKAASTCTDAFIANLVAPFDMPATVTMDRGGQFTWTNELQRHRTLYVGFSLS